VSRRHRGPAARKTDRRVRVHDVPYPAPHELRTRKGSPCPRRGATVVDIHRAYGEPEMRETIRSCFSSFSVRAATRSCSNWRRSMTILRRRPRRRPRTHSVAPGIEWWRAGSRDHQLRGDRQPLRGEAPPPRRAANLRMPRVKEARLRNSRPDPRGRTYSGPKSDFVVEAPSPSPTRTADRIRRDRRRDPRNSSTQTTQLSASPGTKPNRNPRGVRHDPNPTRRAQKKSHT